MNAGEFENPDQRCHSSTTAPLELRITHPRCLPKSTGSFVFSCVDLFRHRKNPTAYPQGFNH